MVRKCGKMNEEPPKVGKSRDRVLAAKLLFSFLLLVIFPLLFRRRSYFPFCSSFVFLYSSFSSSFCCSVLLPLLPDHNGIYPVFFKQPLLSGTGCRDTQVEGGNGCQ